MGRTKVLCYGFTWLWNSQAKFIVPLRSISFAVSSPGSSVPMSPPNEHKQTRVSSHSIPAPLLLGGQTRTWNKKRGGYPSIHRAFHLLPCVDAESDTKGTDFLLTLAWFAFGTCFSSLTSAAGQICQKLQGGNWCLCDHGATFLLLSERKAKGRRQVSNLSSHNGKTS